ncbi:MAG: ATP-binding cassette domain-containing protein [Candidatus Eisenbacteria bacterium]|uniref:ATP-binding cassette domain-containing protein n=1 Tax=Eiseniibacteriota bacterium TaxID=2212470 RepID=A0A538U499_UNCEI|nr:MAG: ATP-binding cassette domain-containing protein [Candidatus Eisenbacteria bacterium]
MSAGAKAASIESTASGATRDAATIAARDLSHRYGPRVALQGVSFRFDGPSVVVVRGPNGSGKSTLLRLLAGLLRPTSGDASVILEGRTIAAKDRHRVLGYAVAAEARGCPAPRARALEGLERVGLRERAADRAGALSSGMAQRLRLAFALLDDPSLLLLDEPGSHLDDEGRAALHALIGREGARRLVVVATNDEREDALAGQRVELRRGVGHSA